MELEKTQEVCGTCKVWRGRRECGDEGVCRVSPSARGLCERTKKPKPPHGGCDQWTLIEEVEHD